MQPNPVTKKIQTLPEPLQREVEDFVDFLLARYRQQATAADDEISGKLLTQLAEAGGSYEWLDDAAEDIYSDADGEPV